MTREDKMNASGETRWRKLNTECYAGKIPAIAGFLAQKSLGNYVYPPV